MGDREQREQGSAITAWPAPRDAEPVLLVGGTFDPVHEAHVRLAEAARESVSGGEGWIVYVPAARSPFKSERAEATDAQRVEMLRIALRGAERASVWSDEIDRAVEGEASYWVDTVRRAREVTAGSAPQAGPREGRSHQERSGLRFLIGADQAVAFHRWRAFREILELATPIVVLRGDVRDAETLRERLRSAGVWTHDEIERWVSWVAPTELMDVCATALRDALGDPRRRAQAIDGLDEDVRAYILREGLYV